MQKRTILNFWSRFTYNLKNNIAKDSELQQEMDKWEERKDRFFNKYSIPRRWNMMLEFIKELPFYGTRIKIFVQKYSGYDWYDRNFSIGMHMFLEGARAARREDENSMRDYEEERKTLPADPILDKYQDVYRRRYAMTDYVPSYNLGQDRGLYFRVGWVMRFEAFLLSLEEYMLRTVAKTEEAKDPEKAREILKQWEISKREAFITTHKQGSMFCYNPDIEHHFFLEGDNGEEDRKVFENIIADKSELAQMRYSLKAKKEIPKPVFHTYPEPEEWNFFRPFMKQRVANWSEKPKLMALPVPECVGYFTTYNETAPENDSKPYKPKSFVHTEKPAEEEDEGELMSNQEREELNAKKQQETVANFSVFQEENEKDEEEQKRDKQKKEDEEEHEQYVYLSGTDDTEF